MLKTVQVTTSSQSDAVDVTDLVAKALQETAMSEGVCFIDVPHTTAGITINEGADPAVMDDVLSTLSKLVPWSDGYKHMEGNSAAHIKTILVGSSCHVVVDNGRLLLGTWQRIFLCEFDGPRTRKIRLKITDK